MHWAYQELVGVGLGKACVSTDDDPTEEPPAWAASTLLEEVSTCVVFCFLLSRRSAPSPEFCDSSTDSSTSVDEDDKRDETLPSLSDEVDSEVTLRGLSEDDERGERDG